MKANSKRNRAILHVDDDPNLLRLVSKVLTKSGYDVFSLDDPTQAARQLLTTGARLVLLDIDMPKLDGMTLLQDIKQQDGGVQVIMLTGMVTMGTVLKSMRWGAEACVFKPLVDFVPLQTAVTASFEKIDRWWASLDDLTNRKNDEKSAIENLSI